MLIHKYSDYVNCIIRFCRLCVWILFWLLFEHVEIKSLANLWFSKYLKKMLTRIFKSNALFMWVRQREGRKTLRLMVSVQAFYITVLLKTCDCDCVNPGVSHRVRLVSVVQVRGSTQGLSSGNLTGSQIIGAQLAPHAWLAHDPAGQDLCLGHVQSCDPLTNWLEDDSHALTYDAASASPSVSSSTACNFNSAEFNFFACCLKDILVVLRIENKKIWPKTQYKIIFVYLICFIIEIWFLNVQLNV